MPVPISNIGSGPYGTAAKSDDANRKIDAEQIESIFQEMSKSQENVAASASSSRRPSWFSRQRSRMSIRRDSKSPSPQ